MFNLELTWRVAKGAVSAATYRTRDLGLKVGPRCSLGREQPPAGRMPEPAATGSGKMHDDQTITKQERLLIKLEDPVRKWGRPSQHQRGRMLQGTVDNLRIR